MELNLLPTKRHCALHVLRVDTMTCQDLASARGVQ